MTLHVTRLGDHGSSIVFLHGLFGQGKNWTTVAKAFSGEHQVLLVDLPHHGRSSWSAGFDFGEAADQVAEVLPPDEPVALVGHSLGGKVAMLIALLHRERVAKLCVADVSPVAYSHGREFIGYTTALRGLDLHSIQRRQDADDALAEAVPDPIVRSFLLQNLRRDGDVWRWQINLEVIERDLEIISGWPEHLLADVAPFEGPVLWLAGERSDYVRQEYAESMNRLFPRNRRVTIKNAGHWIHSEQPEIFAEVLRRFLT